MRRRIFSLRVSSSTRPSPSTASHPALLNPLKAWRTRQEKNTTKRARKKQSDSETTPKAPIEPPSPLRRPPRPSVSPRALFWFSSTSPSLKHDVHAGPHSAFIPIPTVIVDAHPLFGRRRETSDWALAALYLLPMKVHQWDRLDTGTDFEKATITKSLARAHPSSTQHNG